MSKDFNDFLKTLTPEVCVEIAKSAENADIHIGNPAKDENVVNLGTGLASINFIMTVQLLKHYHNWLNS